MEVLDLIEQLSSPPLKWQAVGIFGDGDLGQKRFCWNAAFDDVFWSRGLDDAVFVLKGIFRPAGDDDPELRCDDVQPFANIVFRQLFPLDHHLDGLKRCGAKPLRGRGPRLASAFPRPFVT
jgi:hypothetical protein